MLKYHGIALNKTIPFEFNIPRCMVLILICLTIYSLKTSEFWKEPYSFKNLKQNMALVIIIDLGILFVYFINTNCGSVGFDLYNENLVKALSKGEVYISDTSDNSNLEELEDPYDAIERSKLQKNIDYIWDAAYYNQKYYVYFGALPAIILMVPYYLITGKLLATSTVTMIFSLLSVAILVIITKKIFEKYFKELPFKYMALSSIMMVLGTNLIFINVAPRFYELVTVRADFSLQF